MKCVHGTVNDYVVAGDQSQLLREDVLKRFLRQRGHGIDSSPTQTHSPSPGNSYGAIGQHGFPVRKTHFLINKTTIALSHPQKLASDQRLAFLLT